MAEGATDALVIDFGIDGLSDLVAQVREAARAFQSCVPPVRTITGQMRLARVSAERFASAMERAAAASRQFRSPRVPGMQRTTPAASAAGSGGGAPSGGLPTSTPPSAPGPEATQPLKPNQVVMQQAAYLRAQASLIRAQLGYQRARQQQQKAQAGQFGVGPLGASFATGPGQFGKALRNLVFSTRYGVGAGGLQVAPLVGRSLAMLMQAGPIGAALAGGAVAISLLGKAAYSAAGALRDFRQAMYTGGGTTRETSRAAALGAAVGMDAQDMARLARQFTDAIATDEIAKSFAAQYGVTDYGIFGDVNKVQKLLRWIDALREMPETEAIRAARATSTEGLLMLRDATDEQIEDIQRLGRQLEELYGPRGRREAIALQIETAKLKLAFDQLKVAMIPVITALTAFLKTINAGLRSVTNTFSSPTDNTRVYDPKTGRHRAATPAEIEMLRQQHESRKAQQENTQAMKDLTRAMEGLYGGGDRSRSAIPVGMPGALRIAPREAMAMNLGAFTI